MPLASLHKKTRPVVRDELVNSWFHPNCFSFTDFGQAPQMPFWIFALLIMLSLFYGKSKVSIFKSKISGQAYFDGKTERVRCKNGERSLTVV